MASEKVNKTAI